VTGNLITLTGFRKKGLSSGGYFNPQDDPGRDKGYKYFRRKESKTGKHIERLVAHALAKPPGFVMERAPKITAQWGVHKLNNSARKYQISDYGRKKTDLKFLEKSFNGT